MVFEQRPRLGPPVQPLQEGAAVRGQPAIHLPRADGQQLAFHGRAQPQPPPRPRQPQRQQGLEAQGPGIARGLPDGPQGLDDGGAIGQGAALGRARGPGRRVVEQPDGVLAVMPGHLTELVQDRPLLRASGAPIPLVDRLHIFLLGACTHDDGLHRLRKVTS